MRAIVQDTYGSAGCCASRGSLDPASPTMRCSCGCTRRARTAAHGILTTGRPYLLRLGAGIRRPRNPVPEREVAGTVVAVGPEMTRFSPGDGEQGGSWTGGIDRQLRALVLTPFIRQRLTTFICTERASDLDRLTALIEAGTVRPIIGRTYPLDGVPEAMRNLEAGKARGKVVITL